MNTSFWYIRTSDRGAWVTQIRLSRCACIILFSVFFQGQVITVADQDSSRTGPIKLKKTGVLMCTKHHINGFISGTNKRVKFVENVLCRQKFYHILCCNNLIVCSCVFLLLSTYLTDLLQLYTPSQSLCSFAQSCILIRHKKFQGQCTLYWTCHLE